MPKNAEISALFEKGGELSSTLSHFELREGQVALVSAIDFAVDNKQHLIAEAGTGIGKTFSYLLPTLAKNQKVFVSTATKHLQDQVFLKDLPIIEKVLDRKVSACLLKGRSNYFCHHRYEEFFSSDYSLNKKQIQKANKVRVWSEKTLSGDLSEIAEFTDDDMGFAKRITSTAENCLGGECTFFDQCFVQKVREKANKSELVIINHALLMADIVLKEVGFAEILPDVDVVVIDEAHHLPKIATQAFAEQVTANQLLELSRDALLVYNTDAGDSEDFPKAIEALEASIKDFNQSLVKKQAEGQTRLGELKDWKNPYDEFKTMMKAFKVFLDGMSELSEISTDLTHMHGRAEDIAKQIKSVFSASHSSDVAYSVGLLEWNENYFRAARLPIQLGNRFRDVMEEYANSWLFVSATLSVNQSFDFFKNALGIEGNIQTMIVDSPFDYNNNAVIHVMADLPAPNDEHFVNALIKNSLPIIKAVGGRTFLLFTSYRNLNKAADLLEDSEFTLFVQGDLPKSQLIDAFIQSDNAILLGTVSFWEGVDVPGDNLSCVIIDKIPFPSPGDPIIAEQSKYAESEGKNSFSHCYIPHAATLLKQGAGRLIRSKTDKGVLIFGDNRMIIKGYGKQLINSLPPAKVVDEAALMNFIRVSL